LPVTFQTYISFSINRDNSIEMYWCV